MNFNDFDKKIKWTRYKLLIFIFIYAPILMIFIYPKLDESEFGVEFCLVMIFMIVMVIIPIIILVYLSDVFLTRHFKCVLINDNNFSNIRMNINRLSPCIKFRDMELSLDEISDYSFSLVEIKYTNIKNLKLALNQKKDEPSWNFIKNDSHLGEGEKTLLIEQLKFLFTKGFHVISINTEAKGKSCPAVLIRLGDYDIKQFHWFIMYMRELLFNLEKKGLER